MWPASRKVMGTQDPQSGYFLLVRHSTNVRFSDFFSCQSYFLHRAFGYDGLRLATSWEGLKCLPITIQQKDSCDGTILTRS